MGSGEGLSLQATQRKHCLVWPKLHCLVFQLLESLCLDNIVLSLLVSTLTFFISTGTLLLLYLLKYLRFDGEKQTALTVLCFV